MGYDDGPFRVIASCFGEGLKVLMAVGLGRSTSSYPSLKSKNQSQGKSALEILRRLGKVLLGASQQGKASPCFLKALNRYQEKPAPRDPRNHSNLKQDQWGRHMSSGPREPHGLLTPPWGREGAAGIINEAASLALSDTWQKDKPN